MPNGFDGRLAAHPAARGTENISREFRRIERARILERDVDDVVVARVSASSDIKDVGCCSDEVFREEESGGQFAVVARCAHDDGDAVAFDAEFQRFLDGELVGLLR